jgi:hypothetical protein
MRPFRTASRAGERVCACDRSLRCGALADNGGAARRALYQLSLVKSSEARGGSGGGSAAPGLPQRQRSAV